MANQTLSNFWQGVREFYYAPYRQTLAREQRHESDFFMLLTFMESLGIENLASFYTLELTPFFLEEFHAWHKRMGMDKSPIEGFGCC